MERNNKKMTLISKYTAEIIAEFVNYNFDNRDDKDMSKIISNILFEFQQEAETHNLRIPRI